ncbi:hybrid sensor histidine kinase/response regulator transcription factor [Aestuariivivens insulae]|uniref:hybrid sensor histidine kinase/response regulator transcription factor n=1 Tax=Aestuariivivens insulae TaxID=1621988 RepID=UPI001F55EAEC|nr:two-component regulator propeller domain-containing protein [Aestuariivivens insulae]
MSKYKFYMFLAGVLLFALTTTGQNHTNFSHISPTLNNREIRVTKTVQDISGNIWMKHGGGLLIYDGYRYKAIGNSTIFPQREPGDYIKDIALDNAKNIWLISQQGLLTKYNAKSKHFEDLTPLLKGATINVIKAKNNTIWLGTQEGTVYRYANAVMDSIVKIPKNRFPENAINAIEVGPDNELFLSIGYGTGTILDYSTKLKRLEVLDAPFKGYPGGLTLATDKLGKLWIGTENNGLFVYDIAKRQFIQDTFFKGNLFNIRKELFYVLYNDSNGYVWGGTDGGGLYRIDTISGEVSLFTKQNANESSLSTNTVIDIHEDAHKNLWVITNYGKVNILPNANNSIHYHEGSQTNSPLRILSMYKTSKGVLWVGTDGEGITKITFNKDGSTEEKQYLTDTFLNKGLYIQSITEDDNSNLWLGTYKNGLWVCNTENDSFKKVEVSNSKKLKASDVRTVYKDSKGRIWVGSDVSINVYTKDQRVLGSFEYNAYGLKGSIVESIIEDQNGTVWLGLYEGGLFQFLENKDNFRASSFVNRTSPDSATGIKSMALGDSNIIWMINSKWKLLKFNTNHYTHTSFKDTEVLADKSFSAVLTEDHDNLWLSSGNGICHFNVKDSIIKTYYKADGLQDNAFMSRSAFKAPDGMLYFGGFKGLNYFYPRDLDKTPLLATLQINNIEILNQPASALIPEQIPSELYDVTSLQLKNTQSSFSFWFSAVSDNVLDPKYHYAYRLNGFDSNWITSNTERIATYTNIPAGNYTFEVKAGTKKGIWDIPVKKIDIAIAPPFWNTPLAYIIYLCVLGAIAYGTKRWYALRKNLLLEKINHKKDSELNASKMNFFAKMSHEIQTPITLILGPIEDMLKRAEANGNLLLKQRLDIIAYNAKRLSGIARELTLVRDKELDNIRLNVTKNNLHENIEALGLSFKELARKKHIDFVINCPKNLSKVWYDKEKLEHIIYNLLSNAFKFTPQEGNIQLTVTPINSKKMIKLTVTDSGHGIPREELNDIFKLFYQSKTSKNNKGTGIGLALTKELIDLHKGKIEVESSPVNGTVFTVIIPISKDSYNDSERIVADEPEEVIGTTAKEKNAISPNEKSDEDVLKKTVLIVEDNYDLQSFLKDILSKDYNIILAENGEEGYYYAKSNFPDLILSDIMMPKLDGIEMCRKLQEDHLTKHIPVVLLTAKNSTKSKLTGLQSGAIEYISKPFNTNELQLKVKNIIKSKEHLISKYRKELISSPNLKQKKSQDEIFLENLVANINLRIDDANFKMEELTDMLNMGYSSIYRKCLALTGHSLLDFVRLIRLKKAAILLAKYGYTVSESAFMTGFNDPKYFSRCFKKSFKKAPAEFKKEAQKVGVTDYLNKYKVDSYY